MANTNTSKVFIDIITQFTGTKSIKKAETSFDRLAKSISRVVSVAAIEEFGRASVKAFLADDAAANQLVKTLNNLGIAFNPTALDAYIQNLQNTTGVLDDQLRPAFQSLAVATKDYKTSQDLLSTALDVSQGTGKKLSAVTAALSKAYLGNFAALSRLGAGISKAQIKAGNFNDIVKTLNANFQGDAVAAADTYAGKLKIVNAAFTDVKEIIGKGIVDAFTNLVGETGSATQFANSMRDAAQYVSDIIVGIGVIGTKLSALPGAGIFKSIVSISKQFSGINLIGNLGKEKRISGKSNDTYTQQKALLVSQNRSVVATKKLATVQTTVTKATKDTLLAQKASLVLKTAAKVLDTDQAGILAALNRNLTEDEKNRLLLQQALLNDNDKAAAKLAQTIIQTQLDALALGAQNPLNGWNENIYTVIQSLLDLQAEIAMVSGAALTMAQELAKAVAEVVIDANNPEYAAAAAATAENQKLLDLLVNGSLIPPNPLSDFSGQTTNPTSWMSGITPYTNPLSDFSGQTTINVLIDPISLTGVVTNGQQTSTASGVQLSTTRVNALG